MVRSIFSIIPDPDTLLELEPEELAGYIMEYLNSLPDDKRQKFHHVNEFGEETLKTLRGNWPESHRLKIDDYAPKLSKAFTEALVWLLREGFVAPYPEALSNGWYFITRRGLRVKNATDVAAFHKANLLPKNLLHPVIAQKIWSMFVRGEYDTAIFQAFKEVEVAVHDAGGYVGYGPNEIGTRLMGKAFHTENGPLTDGNAPPAEKQALLNLFVGAIGSYKNPHSHRHVSITAEEAVEMIMLASHLLRIVDERNPHEISSV